MIKTIKYFNLRKFNIRYFRGILLTGFVFLLSFSSYAQCIGFARGVVKPELAPFVHDGNYNATILGEGESVILRKTVFDGQKYRLVVKGVPALPPIWVKIVDAEGEILFDNADHEYVSRWDFDVQTTRTLSIEVAILEDGDESNDIGVARH
jgi:hypothetical protein